MTDYNNGDGFYVRLEVAPIASHADIARAYRRLALRAHPDANPDDPDASRRFREITEAYEVLGDPARRARYDATQARGRRVPARPPAAPDRVGTSAPGPGAPRAAPTSRPFWASAGPGSPVVIGTGHRPTPSAWLWAGPVYVDAPPRPVASTLGQRDSAGEVARLLSELVGHWELY